tara:strand:+ start:494 stop:694 length:201 start_codon:yes stop_codon:yes gene_type:complete
MKMHSMGIGIDPLFPIGKQPSQVVCPVGLSAQARIVCKRKKNFLPEEALIPVYLSGEKPGVIDDIY